jgi:hypothetical protein
MKELYLLSYHFIHVYINQSKTSQLYVIVILIRFNLRKIRCKNGCFEELADKNRRPPNHKNRGKEATESAVVASAIKHPTHGQVRASYEL